MTKTSQVIFGLIEVCILSGVIYLHIQIGKIRQELAEIKASDRMIIYRNPPKEMIKDYLAEQDSIKLEEVYRQIKKEMMGLRPSGLDPWDWDRVKVDSLRDEAYKLHKKLYGNPEEIR
jgi:hypothetical protein